MALTHTHSHSHARTLTRTHTPTSPYVHRATREECQDGMAEIVLLCSEAVKRQAYVAIIQ
jgi:hypothetical protein